MASKTEVLICLHCGGDGRVEEIDKILPGRGRFKVERKEVACKMCLGSGRMLKTITIEPFKDEV